MVVPRSAQLVASDSEFTLYAVTSFKKHSVEFVHKCREQKWIPRDFKYVEGGKEEERKEVERVGGDERKLWGETLRLGRTAWSEAVMIWVHILVLRVFVETVLRYGLPLDFVCALVRVSFVLLLFLLLFIGGLGLTHLLTRSRPKLLSRRTALSRTLRTSTRTWRVMPLAETRRVACSAMIPVRCMPLVRAAPSTRRMCFMNSSSTEAAGLGQFCYNYKGFEKMLRTYTISVHRAQTSIGYVFYFIYFYSASINTRVPMRLLLQPLTQKA